MRDHVAAVPILIHVLEGRAVLEVQQQRTELGAGAMVHVEDSVRHQVEGAEPTRFLVLLLGEPVTASPSPGPD